MSSKTHFQYSVLKYTPDLVTDEFLNVGVALYSQTARFFRVKLLQRYGRITKTFVNANGDFFRQYMGRLQTEFDSLTADIESGQTKLWSNPPADIRVLLNQIVVPDDSGLRFAAPKEGYADDLENLLDHYFTRLVGRHLEVIAQPERDDNDIWNVFKKPLQDNNILNHLRPLSIATKYETFEFTHAWKNGRWNLLQPISFDLVYPYNIRRKAKTWLGALTLLNTVETIPSLYFLIGKPHIKQKDLKRAYEDAVHMLTEQSGRLQPQIVEEDRAEIFARKIKPQIEGHET
jgi:Protein of unknown function (DUF3037)